MDINITHFSSLSSALQPWGGLEYVLLALLVAVEGPLTTLVGAVAASAGFLNPVLVFVAAGVGNLTADTLWYSVGYMGKTEWLTRYGGWFGIKEKFITRLNEDINKHVYKVLFVAKLTLGFVIPTLIAAGLARVPFKRWFGGLFAAECLWTGGLVLVGYYYGYLVQRIAADFRWLSIGGGILFIVMFGIYLSRHQKEAESKA